MDLKDLLKQIADRTKHKENIQTEEATKNAFVMPFLQSLGYDVFNPLARICNPCPRCAKSPDFEL
jgi:hypothetical protein